MERIHSIERKKRKESVKLLVVLSCFSRHAVEICMALTNKCTGGRRWRRHACSKDPLKEGARSSKGARREEALKNVSLTWELSMKTRLTCAPQIGTETFNFTF